MSKIYVIGGGELRQMTEINDIIAAGLPRADGKKPIAMFFPQASSESKPYVNSFYKEFGSRLKCKATCALWAKGEMERDYIAEKMSKADMIYIGGGRYDVLKNAFELYGMRELLQKAIHDGKTIVGNSAGAMILFKRAVSDYAMDIDGGYTAVDGYGLVDKDVVVHADEFERVEFAAQNGFKDALHVKSGEYYLFEI